MGRYYIIFADFVAFLMKLEGFCKLNSEPETYENQPPALGIPSP
jgi:hypothetical protein